MHRRSHTPDGYVKHSASLRHAAAERSLLQRVHDSVHTPLGSEAARVTPTLPLPPSSELRRAQDGERRAARPLI